MNNKEDASKSYKHEDFVVNREDVPSFAFKTEPVFCDKCGDSCMHYRVNYVGIEIDVSQLPKSLQDKINKPKFSLCYPCWINGMLK